MADFLQERYYDVLVRNYTFVLGLTASAIAFAIYQTSGRSWAWSLVPIGLAVLLWAIGFAAGIFHGHAIQNSIKANLAMNLAEQQQLQNCVDEAKAKFDDQNKKAKLTYRIQLWALLLGALLYVAGHGMHIWENKAVPRCAQHAERRPWWEADFK